MNEKRMIMRRIHALDFSIKELELFLDTHPRDRRAMQMLREYRRRRQDEIAKYESQYGDYIVTTDDVNPTDHWDWINSPWPWERQV